MRKMNRISLILFMVSTLLFLMGSSVQASTRAIVIDAADLLSDTEEMELSDRVQEIELSSGWYMDVLTIDDAEGKDATYYAEEWFDIYTTSDDGVICLIDMDNRELVIRTFGEAMDYLTDERIEAILDEAYYGASEEDYFSALESMIQGVEEALQDGVPEDQYIYDEDTQEVIDYYKEEKRLTGTEILVAVVAALAAGGITIGAVVGSYRLKWGNYQYSYRENGEVRLSHKQDTFVNQIVTHRHIPKNNTSGGGTSGGSRSTTHIGAGGRRSGGGSRKF